MKIFPDHNWITVFLFIFCYLQLLYFAFGGSALSCRIFWLVRKFMFDLQSLLPSHLPGQKFVCSKVFLCRLGYWLFCWRNRKHVPCFYWVIETRVEVKENEKCCGNTSYRWVSPQLFRVLQNSHKCFYNSIETGWTCFLFLLENAAMTKKRKTTC